jgi:glucokinase
MAGGVGADAAPPPLAVGIDVGGTKILGRVLDPARPDQAVAERRIDTPRGREAVTAAVVTVAEGLLDDPAVTAAGGVAAVGVGVPGLVDAGGVLRVGPNLPGVRDLDLGPALVRRLGRPATVDNDANCATWAEWRIGAARGADDVVMVTLGTGIGGGLVTGGRLQRGAHGFAGEPGHMMVDPAGPPCPCGRRGCWERFASGSGLGRLGRDAASAGRLHRAVELAGGDPEDVRGEHVAEAATAGDAEAVAVLQEFAWWVAVGIANLVDVLDPAVVVVGGGVVAEGELLLEPVRAAYEGLVLAGGERGPVRIVGAELGAEAGAIGAALLAADTAAIA